MNRARPRKACWLLWMVVVLGAATSPARAAVGNEPAVTPPLVDAPAPPPLDEPPPQEGLLAAPLTNGTGPGLPWPVVLVGQLLAYVAADSVPFLACVACSWATSFLLPLGPGLPLALLLTLLFIPPAAVLSGCFSASLLQWLGDRFGVLRGRLACVGLTSVALSFITYALVIAPIILGMGFFTVALATFLSASALLALPQYSPPGPSWFYSAVGYSFSAVGAVLAVLALAAGGVLAPTVGFVFRPAIVAFVYRLTGRPRQTGEEQWPPSVFGERADRIPWPWLHKPAPPVAAPKPAAPEAPAPPSPEPAPPPPTPDGAPPLPPLEEPAPVVGLRF